MTRSLFSFLFIAFLGTFIAGCGESEEGAPVLHPVTGKLTVGGTAVGNVQVALMPTGGAGRAATGNTDAEGNFTIASPNAGAGAVAGEYKVVFKEKQAKGFEIVFTSHDLYQKFSWLSSFYW